MPFRSFNDNFYSRVAPIPDVPEKTVRDSNSVNEGAKANALNNALNNDFDAQEPIIYPRKMYRVYNRPQAIQLFVY